MQQVLHFIAKPLKPLSLTLLAPVAVLLLLAGLWRSQAVQYIAAISGSGFANHLPPVAETQTENPAACLSQPIKALTFNVRYGSDFIEQVRRRMGSHAPGDYLPWSERYPEIQRRIALYQPDIIGLQEMHTDADIANIVPPSEYSLSSYHLSNFQYGDAALLFKTKRFNLLDSGQIWLGPNSNLPLSLGFEPFTMIRYINWALLRDKDNGFTFLFVNTHFDNNKTNKEASADLLRRRFAEMSTTYPVIALGDFNSTAATERYQRLLGSGESGWINTHDLDSRLNPEETAHPNQLIDHILVGGPCAVEVRNWTVDKYRLANGATLSDHFPVLADIRFTGKKS